MFIADISWADFRRWADDISLPPDVADDFDDYRDYWCLSRGHADDWWGFAADTSMWCFITDYFDGKIFLAVTDD